MAVIAIKDLLEAGTHFGHQTRRWNPKMEKFIFEERNGIHIIDLQKTQKLLDYATQYVRKITQKGGKVLIVGTKRQIKEMIKDEAERCGMPYVSSRWLGGMLTNMRTIRQSIGRLEEIEKLETTGVLEKLPKKEQSKMRRALAKLNRNLGGIRYMPKPPEAIFIIDLRKEHLAVAEAQKLGITVIALVDSSCDPDKADFIIPGNDDAISSVKIITSAIANAAHEGAQFYNEVEKQRQQKLKEERELKKEKKASSKKPKVAQSKQLQKKLMETVDSKGQAETKAKAKPKTKAKPEAKTKADKKADKE